MCVCVGGGGGVDIRGISPLQPPAGQILEHWKLLLEAQGQLEKRIFVILSACAFSFSAFPADRIPCLSTYTSIFFVFMHFDLFYYFKLLI